MVGDGVFDYLAAQKVGCCFIALKPHKKSKLDQFSGIQSVKDFFDFMILISNKKTLE